MRKITIAIDGYSGCGKSSTAKAVAHSLQYIYIDSGAMYRAVTLYFSQHHISLTDDKAISKAISEIDVEFKINPKNGQQETYLNGLNVEQQIREMQISEKVSQVSAISEVRRAMVALQRKWGKNKGVVMDGRDIGTVVFPEAELKVFMLADVGIRAERRQKELLEKGHLIPLDEIISNLQKRDQIDTTRDVSPLKKADDAIELDTTNLTFEEQVHKVTMMATDIINKDLSNI
ncbi:(d)CMP kinase [Peijinzhouia sedimentorum]